MVETPTIWMEARCGSVTGANPSDNWILPADCHQTAEGGFFNHVGKARKHFLRSRWEIIDGDWWCPVCAKLLKQ